jgi:acetyl-CoA synthetase
MAGEPGMSDGEQLDLELAELLDVERFEPPPFARPKRVIWAEDLPKTRSGKIMRRLLRDIAEGRALGDVTTLRDPAVMGQLEERISELQAQED